MREDIDPIVKSVAEKLTRKNLFCTTAESCTGGWIAQTLTSVAGSSAWFDCGFVTYSNQSKSRMLGIDPSTIEHFGAVSEEVARAMVKGAITHSRAGVAVAVTGIAGPDGGTPDKPVGSVVFAWMLENKDGPQTERQLFQGDRQSIRWATVVHALKGLSARLS
ncbi:MAG: CinA family protein [Arenicellales bacterium]|nr:CinA family protein [Arenicellales bacterium]